MTSNDVRRLRARAAMTLAEFGRMVGVGKISVWRCEHGEQGFRAANVRRLRQLADKYGVRVTGGSAEGSAPKVTKSKPKARPKAKARKRAA